MAYSTATPPYLMVPSIGARPALWGYLSTHGSTAVGAAGFVTDALNLGMKVSDAVLVIQSTGTVPVLGRVSAVTSTGATIATTA